MKVFLGQMNVPPEFVKTQTTPSQVSQQPQVAHETSIRTLLMGDLLPKILKKEKFPHLDKKLQRLKKYKKKLAFLAGCHDEDFEFELASSGIACVDERGNIYLGEKFLELYGDEEELMIGVVGHEIGHRPNGWKELRKQQPLPSSIAEMHEFRRGEETKADYFMGIALAELKVNHEPVSRFLISLEGKDIQQSPLYYPSHTRVEIIKTGYADRLYRLEQAQKLFPEYHRAHNAANLIADDV